MLLASLSSSGPAYQINPASSHDSILRLLIRQARTARPHNGAATTAGASASDPRPTGYWTPELRGNVPLRPRTQESRLTRVPLITANTLIEMELGEALVMIPRIGRAEMG